MLHAQHLTVTLTETEYGEACDIERQRRESNRAKGWKDQSHGYATDRVCEQSTAAEFAVAKLLLAEPYKGMTPRRDGDIWAQGLGWLEV